MMGFAKSLTTLADNAPAHKELQEDLELMKAKSGLYVESMIAKDELDFAQIWPLAIRHRRQIAKRIRKRLDDPKFEEKGYRVTSQICKWHTAFGPLARLALIDAFWLLSCLSAMLSTPLQGTTRCIRQTPTA